MKEKDTRREFCFKVSENDVVGFAHNLVEFYNLLKKTKPEQLLYHLRGEHNDFSNWLRYSLGENMLAANIEMIKRSSKTPEELYMRIKNVLESRLGIDSGQDYNEHKTSSRYNIKQPLRRIEIKSPIVKKSFSFNVKPGDIAVPGDVLAVDNTGTLRYGNGVFREGKKLIAKLYGKVNINKQLIYIEPSNKKYIPRRGDLVIGVITDIGFKKWYVDINSPFSATLPLSLASRDYIEEEDFETYFKIGDTIIARVTDVEKKIFAFISMTEPHTHRITSGRIIEVNPSAVSKIIGPGGSTVRNVVAKTGCRITVAQNGRLWIDGENYKEAAKMLKIIEKTY